MIDDCLAVIMAGGDSQRMGRDKASLVLGEQTLLQRVVEVMQTVFPRVVVSVRAPRERTLPVLNAPTTQLPFAWVGVTTVGRP